MSAPAAPQTPPLAAADPAAKGRKKAPKAPKAPKPKKPRRPWGMAPWLLLSALLTAGAAVGALYYPIPGLTAQPEPPPVVEEPQVTQPATPADLIAREQAVAQKEAELAAREEEIQRKEDEVNRVLKELGGAELLNSSMQRAANMYATMAPFKAAPLIAALPVETAVQIIRQIPNGQAAAIIAAMETDSAAEIMGELTQPPVVDEAGG